MYTSLHWQCIFDSLHSVCGIEAPVGGLPGDPFKGFYHTWPCIPLNIWLCVCVCACACACDVPGPPDLVQPLLKTQGFNAVYTSNVCSYRHIRDGPQLYCHSTIVYVYIGVHNLALCLCMCCMCMWPYNIIHITICINYVSSTSCITSLQCSQICLVLYIY